MASRQAAPGAAQTNAGFSLLELLIVVVILLVLSLMLHSNLTSTNRNRAVVGCHGNLEKIYLALTLYQNDNKGADPFVLRATTPAQALSLLIPKSTTETGIFICPGSDDPALAEGEPFSTRRISYAYYMGRSATNGPDDILVSDAQINASAKRVGQPLFSVTGNKPGNNHGKRGGNLLFCGGAVKESGPTTPVDLTFPADVRLLNPP